MPLARISQTLSRHVSPSFIASGRSSGLHPVSSHSCCMYVRAGRPAFARPYVGVHKSTSLMSSSLLLLDSFRDGRQVAVLLVPCGVLPPKLVHYCSQHSCVIAVKFLLRLVSVQVVHPYSSIDTTAAWKKVRFILSVRSDFHIQSHSYIYIEVNVAFWATFWIPRTPLKLVDKFTYLASNVSSTENDIDTRLTKAWTAIDKLSII